MVDFGAVSRRFSPIGSIRWKPSSSGASAAAMCAPTSTGRVVARFLVAALEGCIGVFKVDQSMVQWDACRTQIAAYLNTLKP